MKSIVIEISKDGAITIEAIGFKGGACEKATKAIEQALGVQTKKVKKPEFHASAETHQKVGG